jgi:hypothetical protein
MVMQWPTNAEIVQELEHVQEDAHDADPSLVSVEVRLQVLDNEYWCVRWGDPSFDTDHNGYWGASILELAADTDLRELANDLLGQAEDMYQEDSEDESIGW